MKIERNGGDHDNHGNVGKNDDKGKGGINLHFKRRGRSQMGHGIIIRLASKGVFNGYDDGTFKPQQQITRIESIVAAVRLMGLKEPSGIGRGNGHEAEFQGRGSAEEEIPVGGRLRGRCVGEGPLHRTDTRFKPINRPRACLRRRCS